MFFRRAAVLKSQIEYLKLEGPSLTSVNSTLKIPQALNIQSSSHSSPCEENTFARSTLHFANDSNGNLRALYLALLDICFSGPESITSQHLLLNLKELIYGCTIPIQRYMNLLQRYGLMVLARVGVIKKLIAEFLQLIAQNKCETVGDLLRRYPVVDLAFVVVMRALLSDFTQSVQPINIVTKMNTESLVSDFCKLFLLHYELLAPKTFKIHHLRMIQLHDTVSLEFIDDGFSKDRSISMDTAVESEKTERVRHAPSKSEPPFKRKVSIQQSARAVISEETQSIGVNQSDVIERYKFIRDEPKDNQIQDEFKEKQKPDKTLQNHKLQLFQTKFTKVKLTESGICTDQQMNSLNLIQVQEIKQPLSNNRGKQIKNFWKEYCNSLDKLDKVEVVSPIPENSGTDKKKAISVSRDRISAKKKPNLNNLTTDLYKKGFSLEEIATPCQQPICYITNQHPLNSSKAIIVNQISTPLVLFNYPASPSKTPNPSLTPRIQGIRTARHTVVRHFLS